MWENLKKKVTDLIYEEVEDEEVVDEPVRHQQTTERNYIREDIRRKQHHQQVEAKMKFEYPKRQTSFRFPVIPDQQERTSQPTQQPSSHHAGRSTDRSKPAYVRRRSRRKQRRTNRHPITQSRPIYEQKKLAEELEDIPAFERRQRKYFKEELPAESSTEDMKESFIQVNQLDRKQMPYSKPDELDAVFKKKNKPKESVEQPTSTSPSKERIQSSTKAQNSRQKAECKQDEPSISNKRVNENQLITNDKPSVKYCQNTQDNPQGISQDKLNEEPKEVIAPPVQQRETKIEASLVDVDRKEDIVDLPYHLLDDLIEEKEADQDWLQTQQELLEQTLEHFNIDAKVVAVTQGPTVTRLEIQPALGVKVSRIRNLADDIKLNLAARDIRIEAPIPGKHTVGIEIPNEYPQVVYLQEMLESEVFQQAKSPLTVALGLTIEGEPYFTDINDMPHGLIAGATGSGKSVCINTMILSLLYKSHYDDVKLMLIDPKMVELTQYNGIPHLLTPVITDAKAATVALKWAVDEMERRYELFVEHQVRHIERFNEQVDGEKLPYIVIIIDELADLMLVSPQEVEDYISRIAQKARAAGIHLILATQRPSVDVITGLIKANIPSRIAFAVSSQVDSRTILDANGAERLLGRGDMLFIENGMNKQLRLQGPFVSDDEIDRVVHYLRSVAEPDYLFEHDELFLQLELEEEDELFEDVVEFVLSEERASTSLLQRRFRIGYNRAARLIDSMYDRGIISGPNGSRPRDVLITKSQWENNYN